MMKTVQINMSNGVHFDVDTDIPDNMLEAAAINWTARYQDDTNDPKTAAESFCGYVNSKGVYFAKPSETLENNDE